MTNLITLTPKVPEKYRISVDCRGYKPKSVKTEISDDKSSLVVTGCEGKTAQSPNQDYTFKNFRKTYKLPKNAEWDKMTSFMTSNGQLVIQIPLKLDEIQLSENLQDLIPRIVEDENGTKNVEMSLHIPSNIDPSKVKVSCKHRDLIVQSGDRCEKPHEMSEMTYYRRTTLPENTDFNSLKCCLDGNNLSIKAPLIMDFKAPQRTIPIETSAAKQTKNMPINLK